MFSSQSLFELLHNRTVWLRIGIKEALLVQRPVQARVSQLPEASGWGDGDEYVDS